MRSCDPESPATTMSCIIDAVRVRRLAGSLLLVLLFGAESSPPTPLEERIERDCEDDVWSAECISVYEQLTALDAPSVEEELAIIRLAGYRNMSQTDLDEYQSVESALLDDLRALVLEAPQYADAVLLLARRTNDREEEVSLMKRVFELEPGHLEAIKDLGFDIWMWEDRQFPVEVAGNELRLADLLLSGYSRMQADHPREGPRKRRLASAIRQIYLDLGRVEQSRQLQDRVATDFGFSTLDFGESGRRDSLSTVCDSATFALGLDRYCMEALEMLVAEANRDRVPLPEEVIENIGRAFKSDTYRTEGRRDIIIQHIDEEPPPLTPTARKLREMLESQPMDVPRSLTHYRTYAEFLSDPTERSQALRRVVELDPSDTRTLYELAGALVAAGDADGARTAYRRVMREDPDLGEYAKEYLIDLEQSLIQSGAAETGRYSGVEARDLRLLKIKSAFTIDSHHLESLQDLSSHPWLSTQVEHVLDTLELDTQQLGSLLEDGYERSPALADVKLGFAQAAYNVYRAGGMPAKAEQVRQRVTRELELRTLDYSDEVREENLGTVCHYFALQLGLEEFCFEALRSLIAASAEMGRQLPDDVIETIERMLRTDLSRVEFERDTNIDPREKPALTESMWIVLGQLLESPGVPRSSDHHRVRAMVLGDPSERIEALRRAVELDPSNLPAANQLVHELLDQGQVQEALQLHRRIYD